MKTRVLLDITTLGAIHNAGVNPGGIFHATERLGLALSKRQDLEIVIAAKKGQSGNVRKYIKETGNFSECENVLDKDGLEAQTKFSKPDVLHINWRGIDVFPDIHSCKVVYDLPDIVAVKRPDYFSTSNSSKTVTEYLKRLIVSCETQSFFVHTEKVKFDILRRFGHIREEQIFVLPLGHNSSDLKSAKREEGIRDEFKILCINTVEPRKNMITALKAIERLRKNYLDINFSLTIVGSRGWLSDEVYSFHSELPKDLQERIVFTGYISDDELMNLRRRSHLFLFPSFDEGFGLPIVEALADGLDVVISEAAACREVSLGFAEIVNGNSARQLSDKIAEMYKRRLSGEQSRSIDLQLGQYSWESSAAKHAAAYLNLVSGSAR
ncbi:glycosyltransferase family 1 protein [uncultured Roseibium sp.]|uniref:glycosyltransferase family 4 protein n=1 Tax=uncultured Roseibium sp. TaxID=1936171 RepID=UPI002619E2F0|nr:glycosyltransferase family 1 protein [uncultured Roseibium sp.]